MKYTSIILSLFLFSCSVNRKSTGTTVAVRSVEHIKGNAYRVTTDSFTVIKYSTGLGKYRPDSITIKN